ncbi:MAG: hypothetical protein M1820_010097 [Bogoriella megaspora]|nr:MAG: hypothetical protein M1820_010097 [Bogoriella megaspora]
MPQAFPSAPASCMAYNSKYHSAYNYQPSLAAGIIFVIFFVLSLLFHLWKAVAHAPLLWFLWLFVLGAVGETLGWCARLAAHYCPYAGIVYEIQISVLIMSPAFTQAGIYVVLWVVIQILGRETSPIPPKTYLVICICIDVICGILQATGGGLASSAFDEDWVTWKGFTKIRQDRYLALLTGATFLAVGCMITRGVYRAIELLQGWQGHLITTERYFIALDGAMMIIALAVYNLCNPGDMLAKLKSQQQNADMKVPMIGEKAYGKEKDLESGTESESSPERAYSQTAQEPV